MAKDLLLQERMNDVILKVRQDGFSWRIPAHSLFLVNKSSFFEEMLEERVNLDKPITFTMIGMKLDTAMAVLKYIYENEYPTDVTADLILAAQKWKLQPLEDHLLDRLTEDMTLLQACQIFEELHLRQHTKSPIKDICFKLMEQHAFVIFASDMIFHLSRPTLTLLLASDQLNVPDEAYVFWGIWRWGRRECSMNERSLKDEDVANHIDDLICHIRRASVRNTVNIPPKVLGYFNRCRSCRCRYKRPDDILDHSCTLRPIPTWVDIIQPQTCNDEGSLCLQLSVEKDILLTGLYIEMNILEKKELECFIRIIKEPYKELRRQSISCLQVPYQKLNSKEASANSVESQIILHEPLFLIPGSIYSLFLKGNFDSCQFAWGPLRKRRMKIGNTFVNFHGEGVYSVREIYGIPDVSNTWGPRGPDC